MSLSCEILISTFCREQLKELGSTKPALEDCTLDVLDDYSAMILPNCIQLVESELPLSEADNCEKLSGVFLFRQIFSSYDDALQCLICGNEYSVYFPEDLEKHYHDIHELAVNTSKAKFNENIVFVCVPSNVSEETTLNSRCRFCDTTLKTLSEVRDHYPNAHNKTVRLVPESDVTEISNFFYCGLCEHPSVDFPTHHEHMKVMHRMQTYICRYCTYCTSRPSRLRTHVKQRHLHDQPGPLLQCSVCSVYVHGKYRMTKHIMLSHAVQTGPKTWSCAKCLYPYGDPHELMTHIPTCPKLQSNSESKTNETARNNQTNIFYKCNHCALTFSSEEEIKKHMAEDVNGAATSEEVVATNLIHQKTYGPSDYDKNTCFLCCMRFPTVEKYRKHQHHVHMRWVPKTAADFSKLEYTGMTEGNDGEIGQVIQEIQSNSVLEISPNRSDPASIMSNLEQLEIVKSQMNGQQVFTQGTTETPEGEQAVIVSIKETILDQQSVPEFMSSDLSDHNKAAKVFEAMDFLDVPVVKNVSTDSVNVSQTHVTEKEESELSKEYKHLGDFDISLDDLPDDKELAEIGFPNKIGHFCHLCDAVIKSYRLYYLHMHNLHQLEKRFQCIITACGRTYTQNSAFQRHALNHNQKSEHYCSMCDNVFGDDEELQDHLISSDHGNKYMHVQNQDDTRPALKDCTLDVLDVYNEMILPNCVQLVESELPLSEADNCEKLSGVFLFRQIFSSYDDTLQCLFCQNKYSLRFPAYLEKHYRVIHELTVSTNRAEFNENTVFVCVPSDVNEETTLNSGCRFCDRTLKALSEVCDHYPNAHNKIVRLLPESDVTEISNFFYCSLCRHPSDDFLAHLQHMKVMHRMQTYVCRYCTYCTSRPSRLRTHVKQKHQEDQPGPHLQCSVCSVYLHGKDRMTKHMMLSHAIQTDD